MNKRVFLILVPLLGNVFMRYFSELFETSVTSLFILYFIGLLIQLLFPLIIFKFLQEIRLSKVVAVMIAIVLFLNSIVDLGITIMIVYEWYEVQSLEPLYDIFVSNFEILIIFIRLVTISTGILAYFCIRYFTDNISKRSLITITTIVVLYHIIDIYGFYNLFSGDIIRLIYDNEYYFKVSIGTIILYFSFRELQQVERVHPLNSANEYYSVGSELQ